MVSVSLDMMEDSLIKKIDILKEIQLYNEKQNEILKDSENVDLEAFDDIVEKKGELIDKITLLDDGFQALFNKMKEEIGNNKELYKEQIKRMQDQIQEITGLSASVQAAEYRNKRLAENYFSTERQKLNYGRQTSAAAFNYYRTMNNFKDIPPQFLDQKH